MDAIFQSWCVTMKQKEFHFSRIESSTGDFFGTFVRSRTGTNSKSHKLCLFVCLVIYVLLLFLTQGAKHIQASWIKTLRITETKHNRILFRTSDCYQQLL